jgi:L-2-amino-thiazoline-4-carboxylic acid hydrolase
MTDNPYLQRKSKMLCEFDKTINRIQPLFHSRFGEQQADSFVREARQEYALLIPQLPYLGDKQPFTRFIISTGWFPAMYRVLQRYSGTVEEAGQLVYDSSRAYLNAVPGFARRFLGFTSFTPRYIKGLKRRAAESQARKYAGDYVFTYVEGDGISFDYGVDYTECASCKFLRAQGAFEIAPYLCAADQLYSDLLGWGLIRTMTLAEGAEKCDFRFKKGGQTRVALPA